MASISTDAKNTRRIQFVIDGQRKAIRLGAIPLKNAQTIQRNIESIIASKLSNTPLPSDTAAWLGGVDVTLYNKLADANLVPKRIENTASPTVDVFISEYLNQRKELSPTTLTIMQQARIWLVRFLGKDKRIADVTSSDADAYKAYMVSSGLAKASIGKRIRYVRHYFKVAQRRDLVIKNPFEHISCSVVGDASRREFIDGEIVKKVMDVMVDPQWRLLVALARWGGLRIPSEALALKWSDINFAESKFIVRASKTANHKDNGIRIVPMFKELVKPFQDVFDSAAVGDVYVITRYRSGSVNLRTQFQRYIQQAGVKPWQKIWQNLRATRATELVRYFPSHECAAWLGHTERIADAFYRQVTDDDFARAINFTVPTHDVAKAASSLTDRVLAE